MATLQTFKGPRMLVKFPGAWEENTAYEYMSAVYDASGQSWLSKTDVPSGAALEEGEYWIPWNAPNAQFALLQQTVQTFDQRITDNEEKIESEQNAREQAIKSEQNAREQAIESEQNAREQADTQLENRVSAIETELGTAPIMLVIGDSWSDPSASYVETMWPIKVAQQLGCTLINKAQTGASFYQLSGTPQIYNQLQNAISEISDKDNVKYIFVVGGVNDMINSVSNTNFTGAINNVLATAKNTFTKAKITGCCDIPYREYSNRTQIDYLTGVQWYANCCRYQGLKFIDIHEMSGYKDMYIDDMLHPSAFGMGYLANRLLDGDVYTAFNTKTYPISGGQIVLRTMGRNVFGQIQLSENPSGMVSFPHGIGLIMPESIYGESGDKSVTGTLITNLINGYASGFTAVISGSASSSKNVFFSFNGSF